MSCAYNALGQRVEKYTGSAYTEIAYDAFGNQIGTHNRTTWGTYFVSLGGRPIVRYQDSKTYFLHPNHLGSTTMVTDQTGATIQKTIYYPWGQTWASTATVKDSRFASMDPRDSETGNDPTLFRMYQPRLYRWLSPDPLAGDISNPQSLNRYAYVLNNPTNFIDPTGLCPHEPPPGMVWDPTCHVAHRPSCSEGGMACVFQYHRSTACNDLWYRSDQWGPCPSWDWKIGKSDRGNTISDALAGAPGTYLTLDIRGNLGFGFDEGLWAQTWNFVNHERAQNIQGHFPTMGYVVFKSFSGGLDASTSKVSENMGTTGLVPAVYAASPNPLIGPGSVNRFGNWSGISVGAPSGGVVIVTVTSPTGSSSTSWPLPWPWP